MTSLTLPFTPIWRTHPRETLAVGMLAGVSLVVASAAMVPTLSGDAAAQVPPAPPVLAYKPVAAEEAIRLNAAAPATVDQGPAARPFAMGKAGDAAYANALQCLTQAIYYEAGQESTDGQRAVAQVVLNRVRHPAFPSSVCGVVYQGSTRQTGCQFTFTCDGSMTRAPMNDAWDRARTVAAAALKGYVYGGVGNATHYHANYVLPYWAPTLAKATTVGAHIFYRWAGNWGRPAAFSQAYSGHEANASALRTAALAVVRTAPLATSPAAVAEAMPIAKVDGVAVRTDKDGKRVRVLFTPQAREAVEKVAETRTAYVEKVAASDNLRYALGGGTAGAEPGFGKPAANDTALKAN